MPAFADLRSPLGESLRLRQLVAHEALSEPFVFSVAALSDRADLDFAQVLGEHLTVRMQQHPEVSEEPRYFDGLVEQISLVGQHGHHFEYALVVRPWFWFLSKTQDCKVFQQQTVIEIIETVLADHPIAAVDDRTTTAFTPWPYCVQYRESDFHFLSRLMEQEGIGYYFSHAEGRHTLVLFDSPGAHDPCPGCDPLPARQPDVAGTQGRECVSELACSQRVMPGVAVLQDYDFMRTQVDLRQQRSLPAPHALGDYEVFDYPGLYKQEGDGEQFVRTQLEALGAATLHTTGQSDARGLCCGGLVRIEGALRPSDDTQYLVTATDIVVTQPVMDGAGGVALPALAAPYQNRFSALPTATPWRVTRRTRKPSVRGPQTAVVVGPAGEEIHTDTYGRVKVQFHWDRYGERNERSSCWVRVSSPWAGKSWGGVSIPRIGQEVIVDFLEGDPDQPVVTGRLYNAENMPPFALPAGAVVSGLKTKTHKGQGYNELSMDDTAGKEKITIHGQYDMNTTVLHDQTATINNNRTDKVGVDDSETVGSNQTLKVGANQTLSVGGDRSKTVTGAETTTVNGHRSETVNAGEDVTVNGARAHTVNGTQTTTISVAEAHTVGAGRAHTVGGGEAVSIGAAQAVTVGGAQMVSVGGAQMVSVGAVQKVNVGGLQSVSVGGPHKLSAAAIAINSKAVYKMKAAGTAIFEAPTIILKAGGSKIILNAGGVTIKGAKVTVKGDGNVTLNGGGGIKLKGPTIGEN